MSDIGDPTSWTDREREFFALGWNECLKMQPGEIKRLDDQRVSLALTVEGQLEQIEKARAEIERLRLAAQEACDLLAEYTYGSTARSHGHNARLVLEAALQQETKR